MLDFVAIASFFCLQLIILLAFVEGFLGAPALTEEQQYAVDRICASVTENQNNTFLLHGVTGSGKTEVFLNCIEKALEIGKTAIVKAAEIGYCIGQNWWRTAALARPGS